MMYSTTGVARQAWRKWRVFNMYIYIYIYQCHSQSRTGSIFYHDYRSIIAISLSDFPSICFLLSCQTEQNHNKRIVDNSSLFSSTSKFQLSDESVAHQLSDPYLTASSRLPHGSTMKAA